MDSSTAAVGLALPNLFINFLTFYYVLPLGGCHSGSAHSDWIDTSQTRPPRSTSQTLLAWWRTLPYGIDFFLSRTDSFRRREGKMFIAHSSTRLRRLLIDQETPRFTHSMTKPLLLQSKYYASLLNQSPSSDRVNLLAFHFSSKIPETAQRSPEEGYSFRAHVEGLHAHWRIPGVRSVGAGNSAVLIVKNRCPSSNLSWEKFMQHPPETFL